MTPVQMTAEQMNREIKNLINQVAALTNKVADLERDLRRLRTAGK
jgi:hypothetical protein